MSLGSLKHRRALVLAAVKITELFSVNLQKRLTNQFFLPNEVVLMLKFVTILKSKSNCFRCSWTVRKSYTFLQLQFHYVINYTKLSVWFSLRKSLRKIFKLNFIFIKLSLKQRWATTLTLSLRGYKTFLRFNKTSILDLTN